MIRLAINGYGRIGRVAHRVIIEKFKDQIQVVAINAGESTDLAGWMYLLKYDTVYGPLKGHNFEILNSKFETNPNSQNSNIQNREDYLGSLIIDDQKIPIFSQRDPGRLPWKDLDVDVVIESTGAFTTEEKIKPHINAGAKSVILSAPFKDEASGGTYVLGVNLDKNSGNQLPQIISNASCTTNCIAPVAKIIEDNFGIEKAMMTTIHGYTSDQRLQDGGHKDYRRARAAALNIVPTSTGATKAAAKTIPTLSGRFNGLALRVPVAVGSLSDFTFLIKKQTSVEEVNRAMESAANSEKYKNILAVTREPLVSSDIIGESYSSIVDLSLTQVVGGNMVKIIAWYDNEYGYSNRLVEEAIILAKNNINIQAPVQ
ncbi:MAG: type I glyceraldehyde-3-phosphate dehydrogenase [Candidatus Levybacteria bacterium RIFCSPHIGHO2_01_FULL_36_15]|nr:MAG: type I glyceraldehyde-3-phosphate dehydrogenase [Candidatus Levybacteria bacterium RIFCSPHIGHO2_01_FULL_36_15]OGH37311.1 MAG: type I glyceraldehyde-3-phosphate dehydrogenase [Candidatus Levybacteria bacterium RIFCSPLOWO2_01_FULL_36_10]